MSGICCQRCLRAPCECPFKSPMPTGDTAPQPPPVCCDPSAPVVTCCVCGAAVHTCERTEPVDNDYRCPAHVNGVEMSAGEWVCSDACGYERILAANWKRIAALEAQLAEAQGIIASSTDLANTWARELGVQEDIDGKGLQRLIDRIWSEASGKWGKVLDRTAELEVQLAEAQARLGMVTEAILRYQKDEVALDEGEDQTAAECGGATNV